MLTRDNQQGDLLTGWLTPEMTKLSEELAYADKALSDPRLLKPFEKDAKTTGRKTIPIATYVRMMSLKFRYQISYESTSREVSDSLKWRTFCHLPLTGKVPDDKTLIKWTNRYGEKVIKTIHDTVVKQAVEAKILKGRKMRVDTTVTESNIHYPTDTGLLSDGVRVIERTIKKLKKVVKFKTRFRSRMRSMKKRILKMVKFLKGKTADAKKKREVVKKEILKIGEAVWGQGKKVLGELSGGDFSWLDLSDMGFLRKMGLEGELALWLDRMKKVIDQTTQVLKGNWHIPNRLISLFDPGARPIQKGKLFPKTEFGRKVLIQEAEMGIVTGYQVHTGNPPDQSLLESSLDQHKSVFGKEPKEVATDRGFHGPGQDEGLHERGIVHVSIPVRGKKSGHRARTEKSAWFRRLQRWRAGGEGTISLLKRKYGLRRTPVRGDRMTEVWIGWGCIAKNIKALAGASP